MINAPSLANCSLMTMREQIDELVTAGIDFFHLDLADGNYVGNLMFPLRVVADIRQVYPHVTLDTHLMVNDPERWIGPMADAGADIFSFHSDATRFVRRTIGQIKARGMKAGVVINPSQPIDVIIPYVSLLDYVVLMTVEPGFAGQSFLDGSLERLEELATIRKKHDAGFKIEIDGGVTTEIARETVARGADVLVTGVFVTFNQPDGITGAVKRFAKEMAQI